MASHSESCGCHAVFAGAQLSAWSAEEMKPESMEAPGRLCVLCRMVWERVRPHSPASVVHYYRNKWDSAKGHLRASLGCCTWARVACPGALAGSRRSGFPDLWPPPRGACSSPRKATSSSQASGGCGVLCHLEHFLPSFPAPDPAALWARLGPS
jgi:hypothetical protein